MNFTPSDIVGLGSFFVATLVAIKAKKKILGFVFGVVVVLFLIAGIRSAKTQGQEIHNSQNSNAASNSSVAGNSNTVGTNDVVGNGNVVGSSNAIDSHNIAGSDNIAGNNNVSGNSNVSGSNNTVFNTQTYGNNSPVFNNSTFGSNSPITQSVTIINLGGPGAPNLTVNLVTNNFALPGGWYENTVSIKSDSPYSVGSVDIWIFEDYMNNAIEWITGQRFMQAENDQPAPNEWHTQVPNFHGELMVSVFSKKPENLTVKYKIN